MLRTSIKKRCDVHDYGPRTLRNKIDTISALSPIVSEVPLYAVDRQLRASLVWFNTELNRRSHVLLLEPIRQEDTAPAVVPFVLEPFGRKGGNEAFALGWDGSIADPDLVVTFSTIGEGYYQMSVRQM